MPEDHGRLGAERLEEAGVRVENDDLLAYFRRRPECELCGAENRQGLDPNHVKPKGIGGGSQLDVALNLIAMCRSCHNAYHDGRVSKRELQTIIAEREGLLPEEVEAAVWRLLRTPKRGSYEPVREVS